MFGFRPGCLAVYLARIKGCESSSVLLSKSSHSVQHHTNAGKNHGVVYLHGRCCTLTDERCLMGQCRGHNGDRQLRAVYKYWVAIPCSRYVCGDGANVAECWVDRWD